MRVRTAIAGSIVALAAVTLSGCDGTDSSTGFDASQVASESMPMDAEMSDAGMGADSGPRVDQSAIIRTGNATIRVNSVEESVSSIITMTAEFEGDVQSQDRSDSDGMDYANMTVRVPADRFDAFVGELSDLGDVEYININAMDVTTQVRDIDARVNALQTSIARLKDLQAQAATVTDLVAIESELTTRQGELDSLISQQTYLADQVGMSTLTINIVPQSETALTFPDLGGAFMAGIQGLLTFAGVMVAATVFLAPIAVVVLVVIAVIKTIIRKRRARRSPSAPADSQEVHAPE